MKAIIDYLEYRMAEIEKEIPKTKSVKKFQKLRQELELLKAALSEATK